MDDAVIRAVLCDMDGLLLDSERLSMRALVQSAVALGADLSEGFCRSLIGNPMDRCATMIRAHAGEDFPVDLLVARYDVLLSGMVEDGMLQTRPGASALLDTLDRLDLPRAVVTSSSRVRATHHLGRAALLHRFPTLVTRDEVSRGKPDPEPYLAAAGLLGVDIACCLALEDSYNGIRSAHAAGARVIMVPDLLPPTDEMRGLAWQVLPDLHAVAELLDRAAGDA